MLLTFKLLAALYELLHESSHLWMGCLVIMGGLKNIDNKLSSKTEQELITCTKYLEVNSMFTNSSFSCCSSNNKFTKINCVTNCYFYNIPAEGAFHSGVTLVVNLESISLENL